MAYTIVQPSDFVGEIQIANKTQADVSADLAYFINKYQTIFLKQLFGLSFFELVNSELNPEVTDPVTPPTARMVALITTCIPPADNFVFYYYIRDQVTQTVGVGNVQTNAANATVTSGGKKLSRAWNEMVKWVYEVIKFLQDNADTYPEYTPPDWLVWRMAFGYWWSQYEYTYPRWFNVPDIFCTINDMNI